jgi:drug/metabolite transporter (DMT)-like permease
VSINVTLLVLGSAFLHAAWNAVLKRQADTEAAIGGLLAVAAFSAGLLASGTAPVPPSASVVAWSVSAGAFEIGYFVTLGRALAHAPLGPAYTVTRGGALLIVWPVSVVALGERFSSASLVGALLVGCGLAAVGMPVDAVEERRDRRGIGWAAVCALFIAGYHLCYKQALQAGGVPSLVVAMSLLTALALQTLRSGQDGRRRAMAALREHPRQIVSAGLLATASFAIFLTALAQAGAGAALTLRNTSVIFAQGFGVALGERPRRQQWGGAVLVGLGAIALSWPVRP